MAMACGQPLGATVKPARHFGITAGYNVLYFKGDNTVRNRTFKVEQTLHGPLAGIGLYY